MAHSSIGLSGKRSSSPTDSKSTKRLKSIADDHRFLDASPDSPRVSRIIFDTSAGPRLGDPLFRDYYARKVDERRLSLALEGKRVVGCLAGLWL